MVFSTSQFMNFLFLLFITVWMPIFLGWIIAFQKAKAPGIATALVIVTFMVFFCLGALLKYHYGKSS